MKTIKNCIVVIVLGTVLGPLSVHTMNQRQDQEYTLACKGKGQSFLPSWLDRFYRLIPSKTTVWMLRSANRRMRDAVKGEFDINAFCKALSDGADINQADMDGWTPLNRAIFQGKAEIVRLLLAAGAQVNQAGVHINQPEVNDWVPLKSAVVLGETEIVSILLAADADVNQEDVDGWTPLNSAVLHSKAEIVRILLAAGADVNQEGVDGSTPLDWAVFKGNSQVVKILAFNGAKIQFEKEEGVSESVRAAIEQARKARDIVGDHCLVQQEIINMFAHKKVPAELGIFIYNTINPFAVVKKEDEGGLLRQLMKEQILKNRTARRKQERAFGASRKSKKINK